MADDKKQKPLLLEKELTLADCVALGQTMGTPGFEIVRRLYEAACQEAGNDSIRLDPERPDYERVLAVRAQRARNFNEIVEWVRLSALTHHDRVRKHVVEEETAAVDAVGATFGIHPAKPVKPGEKSDAIKNVFGIHPAKPKKPAK
jgi:hypothetical protein